MTLDFCSMTLWLVLFSKVFFGCDSLLTSYNFMRLCGVYCKLAVHCYVFGFRKCFAWTLAKELQPGMHWNMNTSRTLVLYPDRVSPSRLSLVNIGSLKEEKFCRFNFLQVNCVLVLYYHCRFFFCCYACFFLKDFVCNCQDLGLRIVLHHCDMLIISLPGDYWIVDCGFVTNYSLPSTQENVKQKLHEYCFELDAYLPFILRHQLVVVYSVLWFSYSNLVLYKLNYYYYNSKRTRLQWSKLEHIHHDFGVEQEITMNLYDTLMHGKVRKGARDIWRSFERTWIP